MLDVWGYKFEQVVHMLVFDVISHVLHHLCSVDAVFMYVCVALFILAHATCASSFGECFCPGHILDFIHMFISVMIFYSR